MFDFFFDIDDLNVVADLEMRFAAFFLFVLVVFIIIVTEFDINIVARSKKLDRKSVV